MSVVSFVSPLLGVSTNVIIAATSHHLAGTERIIDRLIQAICICRPHRQMPSGQSLWNTSVTLQSSDRTTFYNLLNIVRKAHGHSPGNLNSQTSPDLHSPHRVHIDCSGDYCAGNQWGREDGKGAKFKTRRSEPPIWESTRNMTCSGSKDPLATSRIRESMLE